VANDLVPLGENPDPRFALDAPRVPSVLKDWFNSLSPNTLRAYRNDLRRFAKWFVGSD
jgi:hypothetical protein